VFHHNRHDSKKLSPKNENLDKKYIKKKCGKIEDSRNVIEILKSTKQLRLLF
jgi:hypothetical protein